MYIKNKYMSRIIGATGKQAGEGVTKKVWEI